METYTLGVMVEPADMHVRNQDLSAASGVFCFPITGTVIYFTR